jgi:hypothetical protein
MPFPTLESRFRASGSSVYKRFSNPELTNQILPDSKQSRSNIKNDSRLLPIESTKRDLTRLTNFIKSDRGKLYIGKQLLLQTGNAFAETRLYNPLSPILNAVPSLHAVRQFGRPIYNILTPTRENRGALQEETLKSFKSPAGNPLTRLIKQVGNTLTSPFKALLISPERTDYFTDNNIEEFYVRPEDDTAWSQRLLAPQPMTTRGTLYTIKTAATGNLFVKEAARELLKKYGKGKLDIYKNNLISSVVSPVLSMRNDIQNTYMSFIDDSGKLTIEGSKFKIRLVNQTTNPFSNNPFSPDGDALFYYSTVIASAHTKDDKFNKNLLKFRSQAPNDDAAFLFLESKNEGNGYLNGRPAYGKSPSDDNAEKLKSKVPTIGDSFSPINPYPLLLYKSEYNLDKAREAVFRDKRVDYQFLYDIAPKTNGVEVPIPELLGAGYDIIRFIFKSVADEKPMHFRGFISTIKENVKPEFAEQRYLGRTERFVNYGGAKRTVNLEFNIVAFSKNELDAMWTRINYLTGLAFPKGVSESGFMIPPLFKITIGDIYEEQPCYIENLDYVMLDESITFDINREVSQVINVTLSLVLLEKRSRYHNSPFYGITEKMANNSSSSFAESATGTPPAVPINAISAGQTANFSRQVQAEFLTVSPSLRSPQDPRNRGINEISPRDTTMMQQRMFLTRYDPEYYDPGTNLDITQPIPLDQFCKPGVNIPLMKGETCEDFYTNKYIPVFYTSAFP